MTDPGPSAGHQFRFAVTVQGSYTVEGDPQYHDPDPNTESEPFRLTVRAWSLAAACRVAAQTPLHQWEQPCEVEDERDVIKYRYSAQLGTDPRGQYLWGIWDYATQNWHSDDYWFLHPSRATIRAAEMNAPKGGKG